jgi:hypothetical protein
MGWVLTSKLDINMYFTSCFLASLIHVLYMHVIVNSNLAHKISVLSRSNVRAGNSTGVQKRSAENVAAAQAATRDNTVFIWLVLTAFSGLISATAAIFTTVIDWKVLGWRNFWLAVCVAGFAGLITFISTACSRF